MCTLNRHQACLVYKGHFLFYIRLLFYLFIITWTHNYKVQEIFFKYNNKNHDYKKCFLTSAKGHTTINGPIGQNGKNSKAKSGTFFVNHIPPP